MAESDYLSRFSGEEVDQRLAAIATIQEALASLTEAVAAKYTKPQGGIPETDLDASVQAALALARTAVQSLSDYYTKEQMDAITAAIAASVNSTIGEVVTTLPSAGAGTLGKMYYVGPDANGFYDRYVTTYDGSTYSWLPLGNTEVDMTQYATVEQLNRLDKKLYGQNGNFVSGGYLFQDGWVREKTGWNITDFIPYDGAGTIVWRFGTGALDGSYKPALVFYDKDYGYLNYYSQSTYVDDRTMETDIPNCAYIRASFADIYKGEANVTPLTIDGEDWHAKVQVDADLADKDEEAKWRPFPLGKLVNEDMTASGELAGNTGYWALVRVTTHSKMTVPFEGAIFRIKTPRNYPYLLDADIYYGGSNGTLSGRLIVMMGAPAQLPADAKSMRLTFRARLRYGASGASNWQEISVAQIESWMESGDLAVEYYDPDAGVYDRNQPKSVEVAALRRVLNVADNADNGMDLLPVFAHISDVHGDAVRFRNYMEFCDAIGGVDFALNTGDATMRNHVDNTSYVNAIAGDATTPMLFCIGNHEASPTGVATLFADNMAELVTQQGYLKAANTPADHCYYYKDFDAKKVRVIVLNYYEDGVYQLRLGQAQINWFVATLASTPAGYGVIVALHAPEDVVETVEGFDKFMQPSPKAGDTYYPDGFYVGDRPIMKIIDAFIARTTLSHSYEDHSATYNGTTDTSVETVNINADFTNVDATTEFIAYAVGHRHEDTVGYYQHATQRQLCVGIVCGIALFGDSGYSAWTNQCDLPRGGRGTEQDAFNLYAIDRVGGNLRIVRVGSDVTIRFAFRDMMAIPYKE